MNKEKGIKVLSIFDGISCGRVALERAGFTDIEYYASEIDKYAIQIAQKNYPDTIQLGDVTKLSLDMSNNKIPVDLLIAGSPCQGFSFAGKQLNFDDPRSALFFEFLRILKEVKPKYFLLENVRMKQEYQDVISEHLGVKPIAINSSLVSAQNRYRLYWTNIPNIEQPNDKGILLKDILEDEVDEKYYLSDKIQERFKLTKKTDGDLSIIGTTKPDFRTIGQRDLVYGQDGKMGALVATDYKQPKQICEQIGEVDIKGFDSIKRVYSKNGKSPTLTSMQGGHRQPKILDNPISAAQRGGYKEDGKTEQKIETSFCEKSNCLTSVQKDSLIIQRARGNNKGGERALNGKTPTLTSNSWEHNNHLLKDFRVRKLTPIECEKLQTLNPNYTAQGINEKGEIVDISDSQRYKALGNGWTVDVIAHIFKNIN